MNYLVIGSFYSPCTGNCCHRPQTSNHYRIGLNHDKRTSSQTLCTVECMYRILSGKRPPPFLMIHVYIQMACLCKRPPPFFGSCALTRQNTVIARSKCDEDKVSTHCKHYLPLVQVVRKHAVSTCVWEHQSCTQSTRCQNEDTLLKSKTSYFQT